MLYALQYSISEQFLIYIIMESQATNQQLFNQLLKQFQLDQNETLKQLIDRIVNCPLPLPHLACLNMLITNKGTQPRQRRDVAGLARTVADSPIFPVLEGLLKKNVVGDHGATMQTAKLISNLCSQNPHIIDNIMLASPNIIDHLFALFSQVQSTPSQPQNLIEILNFFHHVSLKQTIVRTDKLKPALKCFLQMILGDNKFVQFTQNSKKYSHFCGLLLKFHSNVPEISHYILATLQIVLKGLSQHYGGYKKHKDNLLNFTNQERQQIQLDISINDKKLCGLMHMYRRIRDQVLSKYKGYSFLGMLKIFLKLAMSRPVCLVNRHLDSRSLVQITTQLIQDIYEHHLHVSQHTQSYISDILKKAVKLWSDAGDNQQITQEKKAKMLQMIQQQQDAQDIKALVQGQPKNQEKKEKVLTQQARLASQYIQCNQILAHLGFSDKLCASIVRLTVLLYKLLEQSPTTPNIQFLINVSTAKLERILALLHRALPTNLYTQSYQYPHLLTHLSKLLPHFFRRGMQRQVQFLEKQLPLLSEITTQGESSQVRFVKERVDQQTLKNVIHNKLSENINCDLAMFDTLAKFFNAANHHEDTLKHSMKLIHTFLDHFRRQYWQNIPQGAISLKHVVCARLILKIILEFMPPQYEHDLSNPHLLLKNKIKVYRYCHLLKQQMGEGFIALLGDLVGPLSVHCYSTIGEFIDTPQNRQTVLVTVFCKLTLQRIKHFFGHLTFAHSQVVIHGLPLENIFQGLTVTRDIIQDGTIDYYSAMADFVKRAILCRNPAPMSQEIIGTVLGRMLSYQLTVTQQESISQLNSERKKNVDEISQELIKWLWSNLHRPILKLPLLVERILPFKFLTIPDEPAQAILVHHRLVKESKEFLQQVSWLLAECHFAFTQRKMDIGVRLKKRPFQRNISLNQGVQLVANCSQVLGQFMKIMINVQYLEQQHARVTPNYCLSLIQFAGVLLTDLEADQHFVLQANTLIRSTLWFVFQYLEYRNELDQMQKKKKKQKKKQKQKVIKSMQNKKQQKNNQRKKVQKKKQNKKANQQKQQGQGAKRLRTHLNQELIKQQLKKQLKRSKSGPLQTLEQQKKSQKDDKDRKEDKRQSRRKKKTGKLQVTIQTYLVNILKAANSGKQPLLTNKTLQYFLFFVSQNMPAGLLTSPPSPHFSASLSQLMPHLLELKVKNSRTHGFHMLLCKLGLQLLDQNHLKTDYELTLKRYIFQSKNQTIPLDKFLKLIRDNYQQAPALIASLLILEHKQEIIPFDMQKCRNLIHNRKDKQYLVKLKPGVQLHMLNCLPSRRKMSSTQEQAKTVKVKQFVPQGQIHSVLVEIINRTIRLLIREIDKAVQFQASAQGYKHGQYLQPFNLKVLLHTIHYLIRESPSLTPFISRFKCRKLIINELKSDQLSHREKVTTLVSQLLGCPNGIQNMPQILYLSVIIRLFAPFTSNTTSSLLFELCLDGTPLVESRDTKNTHTPFASVIRFIVTKELDHILFSSDCQNNLFRKLSLLNMVTVLMNIRQMAKLLIQKDFVSKLYNQCRSLKKLDTVSDETLWLLWLKKAVIPFYLNPASLLQELNIALHHSKKYDPYPHLQIHGILDNDSINAQIFSLQSLKTYKFKKQWPLMKNRQQQQQDQDDSNMQLDFSSDDEDDYEDSDSQNSEQSGRQLFPHLEEPDDNEEGSYISFDSVGRSNLLNEEWDYSLDNHSANPLSQGDEIHFPMGQDNILQQGIDQQQDQQMGYDDQDEESGGWISQQQDSEMSPGSYSGEIGHSIDMDSDHSDFHSLLKKKRENSMGEQALFETISNVISFEKIDCIPRFSRTQGQQVHLVRFFLQLQALPYSQCYNRQMPHTRTSQQIKQQQHVRDKIGLKKILGEQGLSEYEYVQYTQIYRYDHFIKEFPQRQQNLRKIYSDEVDHLQRPVTRHHRGRRNGFLIQNNDIIQIREGIHLQNAPFHIQNQQEDQGEPDSSRQSPPFPVLNQGQENIQIQDQDIDVEEDQQRQEEMVDRQLNQMGGFEQLLRRSNLGMTLQQWQRLPIGVQLDIMNNLYNDQGQEGQNFRGEGDRLLVRQGWEDSQQQEEQDQSSENQESQMNPQQDDQPIIFGGPLQHRQGHPVSPIDQIQQNNDENENNQPQREQMQEELDQPVSQLDQQYRKMSIEHSKKVSKDTLQAINKLGKNNSKFYELQPQDVQMLIAFMLPLDQKDFMKYPYPLLESACINTNNISTVISTLIAYLHQRQPPKTTINRMKTLHILVTLSKVYSIAMGFYQISSRVPSFYELSSSKRQDSNFELAIRLLEDPQIAQCKETVQLVVGLLDNITMHFFYKSINSIVNKNQKNQQQTAIHPVLKASSVSLLVDLLQSNFVGTNLPTVSKIIMRLCVQQGNLGLFIGQIQLLVQTLADRGLQELRKQAQGQTIKQDSYKIVEIMFIFYEMVRDFQTYPNSLQKHQQVQKALQKIVTYPTLEKLCCQAVKSMLSGDKVTKSAQLVDCFFILYEIALLISKRSLQPEDENKHIPTLPQIKAAKSQQPVLLGNFDMTSLLKQSISHPAFKAFINARIKQKLRQEGKVGVFEEPIVRVASTYPHLLNFDNKRAIFKAELKRLRGKNRYDTISLNLSRQQVFEQSFDRIMGLKSDQLRGKVKVQFHGQEGQDAGGLTRQWLQLLSKQMFNPNYGLFQSGSAGNTFYPSSKSYVNNQHLAYFKFIGRITGKALYQGFLLDVYFTPAFYKHMLHIPITYLDIQQEDYPFFNSMKWILDNAPIQDYLELNFTYQNQNFGQLQTKQLVQGGTNIIVTEENKQKYVQLFAYARMATSIKSQLQAFLQGLHDLVPHRLLRLFNDKELQVMISGQPSIDIQDLKNNTQLVNYVKTDQIIIWLFEVLEQFDMQLRTAFLQFVTGSSRVPVQGFKQLRGMNGLQRFNIHKEFQQERLPRAHTCFNQLDLPNYNSKQILIQKLVLAITQGKEGFGMI